MGWSRGGAPTVGVYSSATRDIALDEVVQLMIPGVLVMIVGLRCLVRGLLGWWLGGERERFGGGGVGCEVFQRRLGKIVGAHNFARPPKRAPANGGAPRWDLASDPLPACPATLAQPVPVPWCRSIHVTELLEHLIQHAAQKPRATSNDSSDHLKTRTLRGN